MYNLSISRIADCLIAAFGDHRKTEEELDREIRDQLGRLDPDVARNITIDAIFAGINIAGPAAKDLRTLATNPAGRIEPAISQLRRAQAIFIRAHDKYEDEQHSDRAYRELLWAHTRLSICQTYYEGLVQALPPAKRPTLAKVKNATAVIPLRISDLNAEERQVLSYASEDKPDAVQRLKDLIAAGRNSGDATYIIIGYLTDESREADVDAWLKAQDAGLNAHIDHPAQATAPLADEIASDAPEGEVVNAAIAADDAAEIVIESGTPNDAAASPKIDAALWPPRNVHRRADPVHAASLESWLLKQGHMLARILCEDPLGGVRLLEPPRSTALRQHFEKSVDHEKVQSVLRDLLRAPSD